MSGVGLTALAVAAMRAIETCRHDRLIDDPYAATLVAAADQGVGFPTTPEALAAIPEDGPRWAERVDHYLGVRSRVFDDFLTAASGSGPRQCVILAAGLDARAYRLDWPAGTALFELDQPKVLQFKQITLAEAGAEPGCEHRLVGVDLRDDWPAALIAAGLDVTAPTVWLAEGLLPYLPGEAQRRLLESVTELSAPEVAWQWRSSAEPGRSPPTRRSPPSGRSRAWTSTPFCTTTENCPSPNPWRR